MVIKEILTSSRKAVFSSWGLLHSTWDFHSVLGSDLLQVAQGRKGEKRANLGFGTSKLLTQKVFHGAKDTNTDPKGCY